MGWLNEGVVQGRGDRRHIQVHRRYRGVWVDKGGDGLVVGQVVENYFTKIQTMVEWCGGGQVTGTGKVHTGGLCRVQQFG